MRPLIGHSEQTSNITQRQPTAGQVASGCAHLDRSLAVGFSGFRSQARGTRQMYLHVSRNLGLDLDVDVVGRDVGQQCHSIRDHARHLI